MANEPKPLLGMARAELAALVEAEGEPDALFSGATSERFRQFISKERG